MVKILRFRAKNFKNIKEVEIVPGDDSMVIVGGLNAAGKTSCLSAIQATLGGKRLIDKMPIRDGEETGFTEVMLDEDGTLDPVPIIVRRHWEEFGRKTWLTITTKDGYEAPSPQHILDQFFSAVTFDPLSFSRMTPGQQAASLRDLVGLDIEGIEIREQEAYKARADINRIGLQYKNELAGMPGPFVVDDTPCDVVSLSQQLNHANIDNAELDALVAENEKLKAKIEASTKKLALNEHRLSKMQRVDIHAIMASISSAEARARMKADNEKRARMTKKLEELRATSKDLSDTLAALAREKAEALNSVEWPMEGLSVDGDQVLYFGVPLSQISSSEGLDVAVAIGIAMNPSLKVMMIKDGALIGDEKLDIIRQRAEEHGYQIWVEDVCRNADDTARCTVLIEDGVVVDELSGQGS